MQMSTLESSGHRRSFVKSEWAAVRGSLSNL